MAAGIKMEMSKTYQYRKVMKPMLERKRRARINKCLDELKDIMVTTLESEGEHVTRLEKADILELTVTHLQKLKQKKLSGNNMLSSTEAFRSGYIYAANEVSRTLSKLSGVNVSLGTQLMTHLGQRLNQIQPVTPIKIPACTPITYPLSVDCFNSNSHQGYHRQQTSSQLGNLMENIGATKISNIGEVNRISHDNLQTSYSLSLSPISNMSESPKSDIFLMKTNMTEGLLHRCNPEPEENVWRPW